MNIVSFGRESVAGLGFEYECYNKPVRQKLSYSSPWKFFFPIIICIFTGEFLINFICSIFNLNLFLEGLVDSFFLIILMCPVLYFFEFKPLITQIEKTATVKKELRERLDELQKFKLAVEGSLEQIVISDSEGVTLFANPATEKITGYSVKEAIGRKAGELWGRQMEKSYYEKLWKTISVDKKTFSGEINNKRKNGENYVAELSISPILSVHGKVKFYVSIERDITKAKEMDRMKTEFISLASHQLRTPLTAMKWSSELLLGETKLTGKQLKYIKDIADSNERMTQLVNTLLNISRIESGGLTVIPKPTILSSLMYQVLRELEGGFKAKGIRSTINIDPNLPAINIDPKLITEVYVNLLTNAVKYSPKGGKIKIRISKDKRNITTQITDTGLGIPRSEHGSVFQKFYRGSNILSMHTDGTGLGLYLAKEIIESSSGKIWFESSDSGTTFFFSLPLTGSKGQIGNATLGS